jgi:hypothetical protein
VGLDLCAEPELESALRICVHVVRLDRDRHRVTSERNRDPSSDPDPLGLLSRDQTLEKRVGLRLRGPPRVVAVAFGADRLLGRLRDALLIAE